jgi:hypothetical protein
MFVAEQTGASRRNNVRRVDHHLKSLIGGGLALFLCGMNALADEFVPTVAEAHEFLADTFQRYPVSYVVRYGPDYGDRYKGWVAAYGGNDCHSQLRPGRGSAPGYAIDWSVIASIQTANPSEIYFSGQIFSDPPADGDRYFSSFDLYYPDPGVRQRAFKAFEVLRKSCRKLSKFD